MRRAGLILVGVAWFGAGCGESVRHDPARGVPGETVEGPLDARKWIAVSSSQALRLVGIDDPSAPKSKVLVSARGVGAFGAHGDRFAFATQPDPNTTVLGAVSAPAGTPLHDPWVYDGRADELVWAGDDWIFANSTVNGATGGLVKIQDWNAPLPLPQAEWALSDNGATLVARLADDRLMVVGDLDGAEWSDPVPGDWRAFPAGNGNSLAIVGGTPWPDTGLSISTTVVPTTAPVDRARVAWPTPDEPLLVELSQYSTSEDATGIELVVVNPAAPAAALDFTRTYEETGQCWVRLADGSIALAATDDVTVPWSLLTGELTPTAPNPLLLSTRSPLGVPGFPDFMVASGDGSRIFVDTYDGTTSSSTVLALSVPLGPDSVVTPLFATDGDVKIMTPDPVGHGLVIGANLDGQFFGTACDTGTTGCDSGPYFVSDGHTPATALPDGFYGAVWTPDGQGVIGLQGDNVVYVDTSMPSVAQPLAVGDAFTVPKSW
ncbi:MAG TPA: hypothetical protein VMI54_10535 [Polyangiaceae bacterium]|nr:hypothetical protein [Polyangiaceae bacterium]